MLIKVDNNLTNYAEYTYLSNNEVVGTNSLRVKNINPFSANWAVQIGAVGQEMSEITLLNSSTPSGTALSLSGTTRFQHGVDTPVYAIKYDKIIFKRSTSGTSGTASAIATVPITPDSLVTQYDDTSGATSYAYKTCFYNSALAVSSTDSDWITPAGYSFYSLAKIRDRIKNKLWSSSFIQSNDVIDEWINEWLEKMTNAAVKVNQDYALGTTQVTFASNTQLGTITAEDFKQPRSVYFITSSSGTQLASAMGRNFYDPNDLYTNDLPYYYFEGDNLIGRAPYTDAGTARIVYYKLNPILVNDGDLLPLPMRGYTKSFVDYGLAQAKRLDNKVTEAERLEAKADEEKINFVNEIAPRNKTGNEQVQQVEDYFNDDLYFI